MEWDTYVYDVVLEGLTWKTSCVSKRRYKVGQVVKEKEVVGSNLLLIKINKPIEKKVVFQDSKPWSKKGIPMLRDFKEMNEKLKDLEADACTLRQGPRKWENLAEKLEDTKGVVRNVENPSKTMYLKLQKPVSWTKQKEKEWKIWGYEGWWRLELCGFIGYKYIVSTHKTKLVDKTKTRKMGASHPHAFCFSKHQAKHPFPSSQPQRPRLCLLLICSATHQSKYVNATWLAYYHFN